MRTSASDDKPRDKAEYTDQRHGLPDGSDKVVRDGNGICGEAIDKPARFEEFCERLVAEQEQLSVELEQPRQKDQTRTLKFRERMAKKLRNGEILGLFEVYDLR